MKHCIIIPTYNTGMILRKNVAEVLECFESVIVVVDGSNDGSDHQLETLSDTLKVIRLNENKGKGAAVLRGISVAHEQGYTHALTIDADGQHPVGQIGQYLSTSREHPEALILGVPIFDESAPALRKNGRKISNGWSNLVTLWWGISDSLFGMRVYPIAPLLKAFDSTSGGRRFDFDPEMAIRLCWMGLPTINLPTPVRYLSKEEGGVSQFRYLRDNTLLTGMYFRLILGFVLRFPGLFYRRLKRL